MRERSAGIEFSFVDLTDPDAAEAALKDNTRMIWIESPSNPLLKIVDFEAIAELARARDILNVADNGCGIRAVSRRFRRVAEPGNPRDVHKERFRVYPRPIPGA